MDLDHERESEIERFRSESHQRRGCGDSWRKWRAQVGRGEGQEETSVIARQVEDAEQVTEDIRDSIENTGKT